MDLEKLRYPIGRYHAPAEISENQISDWIAELESIPSDFKKGVLGLTSEQLDTPYRPEGWTVRQVVHHVPDSHLNSYVRFRWTLTEDTPIIKAYDEKSWAELGDSIKGDVQLSLDLLESLHRRWVVFLKSLDIVDFKKQYIHPEMGRNISLDWNLGLYAWHGRHHLSQILSLKERMGW